MDWRNKWALLRVSVGNISLCGKHDRGCVRAWRTRSMGVTWKQVDRYKYYKTSSAYSINLIDLSYLSFEILIGPLDAHCLKRLERVRFFQFCHYDFYSPTQKMTTGWGIWTCFGARGRGNWQLKIWKSNARGSARGEGEGGRVGGGGGVVMFQIDQHIIRMCSFHFCSQKAAICYFGGCCGWVGATCKPSIVLCSHITELIPDHRSTVTSNFQFSNFTSRIVTSLRSISVLLQSCTFLKRDRLQRQQSAHWMMYIPFSPSRCHFLRASNLM